MGLLDIVMGSSGSGNSGLKVWCTYCGDSFRVSGLSKKDDFFHSGSKKFESREWMPCEDGRGVGDHAAPVTYSEHEGEKAGKLFDEGKARPPKKSGGGVFGF